MKGITINKTEGTFEMTIKWWYHYTEKFIEPTSDADGDGISFSFFVLFSYFLNKTEIHSNNSRFTIKHRPFDLLPNTYYEWNKVNIFYVAEKLNELNDDEPGLYAELINGEVHLLIHSFKRDTLFFIEKELNLFLGKNTIKKNV